MARVKTDALRDWIEDAGTPLERRALILQGPNGSPNAYVGVPEDSLLAGKSYDDMPLDVHGGLTFASEGHGPWPKGWFWYGWDYSHAGDFLAFAPHLGGRQWTVEDIEAETREAMKQLGKMLAEVMCD